MTLSGPVQWSLDYATGPWREKLSQPHFAEEETEPGMKPLLIWGLLVSQGLWHEWSYIIL